MREILFRGKRIDNGEWVCGYLHIKYFQELPHDRFVIEYEPKHNSEMWQPKYMVAEIDPDTVGQFAGLTDKNGEKIFEGDILRIVSKDYVGFNEVGKVEFKDGCFGASYFPAWERKYSFGDWHFHRIGQVTKWQDMGASGEMKYTYEVVGNIHDNPELLEVTE